MPTHEAAYLAGIRQATMGAVICQDNPGIAGDNRNGTGGSTCVIMPHNFRLDRDGGALQSGRTKGTEQL